MLAWFARFLLDLLLKFGLPYVLNWVATKAPWLKSILDLVLKEFPWPVFTQYVENVKDYGWEKSHAKALAKTKLHECYGVSCPAVPLRDEEPLP